MGLPSGRVLLECRGSGEKIISPLFIVIYTIKSEQYILNYKII